jgi:hypothetical protein
VSFLGIAGKGALEYGLFSSCFFSGAIYLAGWLDGLGASLSSHWEYIVLSGHDQACVSERKRRKLLAYWALLVGNPSIWVSLDG